MKVFIVQIDSVVQKESHTSLLAACTHHRIPYSTASRGKRKFIIKDKVYIITEGVKVIKVKGRGNKNL